jgi:hypothetical protein
MNDQPARPSSSSGGYDPRKSEGEEAVFAMWEASIRDADDHHHGFQFVMAERTFAVVSYFYLGKRFHPA